MHIPPHLIYLDKTEVIDFSILNFSEGNGEFPFLELERTERRIIDLRKNEKFLRLLCGSKEERGTLCNKIKMGEKGGAFLMKYEGKEGDFLQSLASQKGNIFQITQIKSYF